MKDFLKALSIIVLPIVFWFCIIATGFGAQSLTHIIEIPIVFAFSIVIGYILRNLKTYEILTILFFLVFLLRLFMPCLP